VKVLGAVEGRTWFDLYVHHLGVAESNEASDELTDETERNVLSPALVMVTHLEASMAPGSMLSMDTHEPN